MLINYLLVFLFSLSSGIFFVFCLKKFSLRYRFLVFQGQIPLIGGIAIGLSFILAYLAALLFLRNSPPQATGIIATSFIMLVFGIIDDWRELSVLAKFLVQIICVSLLISSGVKTQIVYIGNAANIIITFIWVLGISNAFNHLDVIDGLAAGSTIIISTAFFAISILSSDVQNAILTLSLGGAVFGFLIYNLPPARVYMGNSGSHFLGFILAAVALAISYAPLERKIALLSPVLILGLPVFDTAFLILARIIKKRLPFKKSNDHLALRLLALGYSKGGALLVMLYLCLFFSLCGVLLIRASTAFGAVIIALVALVTLTFTKRMSRIVING